MTGRGRGAAWHRLAFGAVLLLAAALRLWNLGQNGYGNEYYSAAVMSMASSWHNFFYAAFDPSGFLAVDKPPVAFWLQVASVKLLGFGPLALLLPQALLGVAAVALLHLLVARRFGPVAGLLAALFLSITPISVAVDRYNNTESCLMLALLLAFWALERALEQGSRRFLLLSMALVGVGFNVKLLAAFALLPVFVFAYLLFAPCPWRRRIADLALASLVLAAVSLVWVAAYDLTPPKRRPYAGTSNTNSMLDLAIGVQGFRRVAATPEVEQMRAAGRRVDRSRHFPYDPPGPWRLLEGQTAAQTGWFLPPALLGILLVAFRAGLRRPLSPEVRSTLLWLGWTASYGVIFSAMRGVFLFHYLALLAPPIAALAGIGASEAWALGRGGRWRGALLPATALLVALWQVRLDAGALGDAWHRTRGLDFALLAGALVAAGALGLGHTGRIAPWRRAAVFVGAVAALLSVSAAPVAWSLSAVLVPQTGNAPSADLARLVSLDDPPAAADLRVEAMKRDRLIHFLVSRHRGERFVLAASTAQTAAPVILRTGRPVLAVGGFYGTTPVATPDRLARMVARGELRYAMIGDVPDFCRPMGADRLLRPVAQWVKDHGRPVDPALWRAFGRRGIVQLYALQSDER